MGGSRWLVLWVLPGGYIVYTMVADGACALRVLLQQRHYQMLLVLVLVAGGDACQMSLPTGGDGRYFAISDDCYVANGGTTGTTGVNSCLSDPAACEWTVTVTRDLSVANDHGQNIGDTVIFSGTVLIWHSNENNPDDATTSMGRQNTCATEGASVCEGFAGQWQAGDLLTFVPAICSITMGRQVWSTGALADASAPHQLEIDLGGTLVDAYLWGGCPAGSDGNQLIAYDLAGNRLMARYQPDAFKT